MYFCSPYGAMAEWLGTGLQNLLQRFDSASHLQIPPQNPLCGGFLLNMNYNIGLFNDSFPPVMDGVGICVENYARWMQEKVGGVSVITPKNLGADYSDKKYEVLDYLSVKVPFRAPYVTGISEMDPNFVRKIIRRNFKIVHAHCPFMSGLTAARVAKIQHIPMVATFHSKYREDFARVIHTEAVLDSIIAEIVKFYERADEVWVPQESVKEVLRSYGFKGNIEVQANGSDLVGEYPPSYYADARRAVGVGADEFVLLYVGQHIWEKNVRMSIEALARIKDLPYRMFFIGTGYAAEEMKQLVDDMGIADKVTFVGRLTDREKLKQYYASANLFLFPSLYDTDGLVVKEAACFGTPSVMLREASASGMLTDGETGFLIGNNVDEFEALLRRLYVDRELGRRVGHTASGRIVRSWEDIAGEVIDRYNSLIARKCLIRPL